MQFLVGICVPSVVVHINDSLLRELLSQGSKRKIRSSCMCNSSEYFNLYFVSHVNMSSICNQLWNSVYDYDMQSADSFLMYSLQAMVCTIAVAIALLVIFL